jgi:NAD/NADP transhydrogenase beta subunit
VSVFYSLAYLLAAVLFILGLKQLSSPKTARNGTSPPRPAWLLRWA